MPFFAMWGPGEKVGNAIVTGAAGPIAGIGANYAITVGINGFCALYNGASYRQ